MEESFLSPMMTNALRGPRRVAIDVGANKGEWTLWMAGHFDHVLAVDADPRAYHRLLEIKPSNVHVMWAAVTDRFGAADFFLRPCPDQSSLLERHPIGAGDQADAPVHDVIGVNAVTLDFLRGVCLERFGTDQIDFVKVDVEGAEASVLNGATPDLWRDTRWLIEIHDTKVAVGHAVDRLGHEEFQVIEHPSPNAHPNHLWVLVNAHAEEA